MKHPEKPLKDLTNAELKEFLEDNENTSHRTLAWVCSEILRRTVQLNVLGKNELYLT